MGTSLPSAETDLISNPLDAMEKILEASFYTDALLEVLPKFAEQVPNIVLYRRLIDDLTEIQIRNREALDHLGFPKE